MVTKDHIAAHTRDETILQYINVLQYLLLQYGSIQLKKTSIYCTLQYIVIHYIATFAILIL